MINKTVFRVILATGVALSAFPSTAWAQDAEADAADDGTVILVSGQRQQYRGDVALEEIPQSVQVIDSELLVDLNVTGLASALDLASGVSRQNNFGGLWDAFAVRGFAGDENFPSGFLVNGFNGGRGYAGARDSSNIERIEVLKGPNGAVFGRGEPGGTVNIITRKATIGDTFGSLTLSAGSFETYRGEVDLNLDVSDNVAFRINGAYENSDGFRDYVGTEKFVLTPSVMFDSGSGTSLSYELEFVDLAVPFDRGIPAINGVLGGLPSSLFVGEPGDGPTEVDVLGHQVQFQQELGGNNWVFLAGLGYRETSFVGFSSDPELSLGRQTFDNDGINLLRQRRFRDYETSNVSLRGEVSGRIDTGEISHHLLFGADWDRFKIDLTQLRYRAAGNTINVFNPVYGNMPVPTVAITDSIEVQEAYGLYVQDQIDLTDSLKLRVGGRFDHFNQDINSFGNDLVPVTRKRFSPTVGLLYEVTDSLGLYAAYGTGFRPNSGLDVANNPFAAETSESYEAGLRFTSFDDAITATLAAYWMKKDNILTSDPINGGFSIAAGAARSQGIEADISANLPGDVQIMATYAYTDAAWTSSSLDFNFGLSILPGDPLINIPKHTANLVVSKDIDLGNSGSVTIGGGLNYVGRRLGETASNFYLPSYTLARLFVSYEPTENIRLGLDVSNLFDTEYYVSSYHQFWVAPGTPRAFTVRASYSF